MPPTFTPLAILQQSKNPEVSTLNKISDHLNAKVLFFVDYDEYNLFFFNFVDYDEQKCYFCCEKNKI